MGNQLNQIDKLEFQPAPLRSSLTRGARSRARRLKARRLAGTKFGKETGKLSISQNAKEHVRLLEESERTVSRAIISEAYLTEEIKMTIKRNFCSSLGFELIVRGKEGKVALAFGSFIGGLACTEAVVALLPLGPRAAHMAAHILLINAVAPALARAWLCSGAIREPAIGAPRTLFGAAAAQLSFLWIWHAPGVIALSSSHVVARSGSPRPATRRPPDVGGLSRLLCSDRSQNSSRLVARTGNMRIATAWLRVD